MSVHPPECLYQEVNSKGGINEFSAFYIPDIGKSSARLSIRESSRSKNGKNKSEK